MTTGLLLRVALRRHLSRLQWMALLLLMAGAATSQINTDCSKGTVQSVLHAPLMVRPAPGLQQRLAVAVGHAGAPARRRQGNGQGAGWALPAAC